jgi:hypothetical protein
MKKIRLMRQIHSDIPDRIDAMDEIGGWPPPRPPPQCRAYILPVTCSPYQRANAGS